MASPNTRFFIWMVIASIALGMAPLAKKLALTDNASPLALALSTALIAAVLVSAWLAARGGIHELLALRRRQAGLILLIGALGSGLVPLLAIVAMTETSAANRGLFQAAYPAATAVAARMMLGETLSKSSYMLIGVICFGLAAMNVDPAVGFGRPFWLLLSTLPLIGIADSLAKKSLHSLSPEIVAAGRMIGGSLVLSLALPAIDASDWRGLYAALPWVVVAGIGMAGFSVALYQVVKRTEASIAAALIALAPVLTLLGERALLDVELDRIQWFGFATVVIAVIALSRRIQ